MFEGKGKTGPMSQMKVVIDDAVYQKIMYWVRIAPGECSGLGKILFEDDGTIRVVEAVLLKQQNGSTTTEIDPAAVGKAMFELREAQGHLNFWWHSHVNMGVFWSGTDRDTIREIGQNGFVLATVFNKKCERKSAFFIKENGPIPELFMDDLDTTVERTLDDTLRDQWKAEFEAKCETRSWSKDWDKKKSEQPSLFSGSSELPDPSSEGAFDQEGAEATEETESEARFNNAGGLDQSYIDDANDKVKHDAIIHDLLALEDDIRKANTPQIARKSLHEMYMLINSTKFTEEYAAMLRLDASDVFHDEWAQGAGLTQPTGSELQQ